MVLRTFVGGALLLAALSGCATTSDFRVTYLTRDTFAARPASQEIEVTSEKPKRPHVAIVHLQGWDAEEGADGRRLMAQMRRKARELGGDAIVEFQLIANAKTDSMRVDYVTVALRKGAVNAFGVVVRWKE